jgi:menaquinol-cytochrome c reductase iron-sulfur subunit
MVNPTEAANPQRREFLKKACTAGLGGVLVLAPLGAGLAVFFDPLRRKSTGVNKVFVTSLEYLPKDGIPRKFSIFSNRIDAWNKFPNAPIGAVYLRRTGEKEIEALNVVCPHAGCFVDYKSESKSFFCPCHNSSFALNGQIANPKSPSPRGMDTLSVELLHGNEVWVAFQNFQTGHPVKIPVV